MGILNYEDDKLSGEEFFLRKVSKFLEDSVVLDVGANVGTYSNRVKYLSPGTSIYAFEPHPQAFKELEIQANQNDYTALNTACSNVVGNLKLYDYKNNTSHASLYEDVIHKIHRGVSESFDVNVTTIDTFIKDYKITHVSLLKIDTEGNEFKVLLGAKQSLTENLIDIIQLEFNEMNIVSKVFFKDIYELLNNYLFYRLLPDGLVFLGEYNPLKWEIFAYQNIIAINKSFLSKAKTYIDI